MISIHRKEIDEIQSYQSWLLLYGRRKTGKTYLVKNYISYDDYIFVNRGGTIISEKRGTIPLGQLEEIIRSPNMIVIIDEFQRLDDSFLDTLHRISADSTARLILVSSTLSLAKKITGSKSPILGLFAEFCLRLLDLDDILAAFPDLPAVSRMELAMLMREPIVIRLYDPAQPNPFVHALKQALLAIPALVGEVFTEEQRQTSKTYEGIMRAVASGKNTSSKISSHVFSAKCIARDDPSVISGHLRNLVAIGVLTQIPDLRKNRYYYYHVSPLCDLYYYADEKYGIANTEITDKLIQDLVENRLPHLIQRNVREALAKKLGLREAIQQNSTYDVDGVLLRFKKPQWALEVKWQKPTKEDVRKAVKNLQQVNCERRILVVKEKTKTFLPPDIEIWDADDTIAFLCSKEQISGSTTTT